MFISDANIEYKSLRATSKLFISYILLFDEDEEGNMEREGRKDPRCCCYWRRRRSNRERGDVNVNGIELRFDSSSNSVPFSTEWEKWRFTRLSIVVARSINSLVQRVPISPAAKIARDTDLTIRFIIARNIGEGKVVPLEQIKAGSRRVERNDGFIGEVNFGVKVCTARGKLKRRTW